VRNCGLQEHTALDFVIDSAERLVIATARDIKDFRDLLNMIRMQLLANACKVGGFALPEVDHCSRSWHGLFREEDGAVALHYGLLREVSCSAIVDDIL